MKSVNEQFAEMQKKTLESLEPLKNMNALAAEGFERIARKNYDLMGDWVNYAVAQVKTPTNATNLQEAYKQHVAETKTFAEKVNARATEYVAIAGELGEMAKSKAPAASKAKPSTAEASPVVETVKAVVATVSPAVETANVAPAKSAAEEATPAPVKAAPVAQAESKAAPAAAKKKVAAKKATAKSK